MKWKAVWVFLLVSVAVASAYSVHEEVEEDKEPRGKRYQDESFSIFDDIFNIPVSTLQAVTKLVKNRYRYDVEAAASNSNNRSSSAVDGTTTSATTSETATNPSSSSSSSSSSESSVVAVVPLELVRYRAELKRQRNLQRRYQDQLRRRRFEQMIRANKRSQQRILEGDARGPHRYHRDPLSFSAVDSWVSRPLNPRRFNGHQGHGDGHVYQYYDPKKPLSFSLSPQQAIRPVPTELSSGTSQRPMAEPAASTTSTTTTTTTTTTTSSSTTAKSSSVPNDIKVEARHYNNNNDNNDNRHNYAVHESIDEGENPFALPNWFGIIHVVSEDDAARANDQYKSKHAQARKNQAAREEELTGNEIDGDLAAASSLSLSSTAFIIRN